MKHLFYLFKTIATVTLFTFPFSNFNNSTLSEQPNQKATVSPFFLQAFLNLKQTTYSRFNEKTYSSITKINTLSTCTGNADVATVISGAIGGSTNATGSINGTFAQIHDPTDTLVLDLTDTIIAGQSYDVIWRRKSTYGNTATADIVIAESVDNSNWTTNPTVPSTSDKVNFTTSTLTATVNTRYLKIWEQTNSNDDADLDAISYTDVDCNPNSGSGGGDTPLGNLTCMAGATEITGTVFIDANYNGAYDTDEYLGVENVTIRATDSLGNTFTTTTVTDGTFTISGLTAGRTYRIEFTNLPTWAFTTSYGGDNGTTIQFIQSENCANLGIAHPDDYCQANPTLLTACFDAGTTSGANSGSPALVGVDYQLTAKTPYATFGQAGSTWGIAYQKESKYAYAATFLKRNVGISQGLGHIHIRDMNSAYLGSFSIDGVEGIDMGSVDRSSGSDYQLSPAGGFAVDLDAFEKVGKVGFGDIDIYNDDSLTVVNLNSKSLINIDISNTGSLPTNGSAIAANLVQEYPLTFPDACTAGEMRPFGLKYHRGTGYLGVVCDASISKDSNDLMAYVYEFDPENIGGGLTKVLEFALDYPRELKGSFTTASGTIQEGHWQPWVDTWAELNKHVSVTGTYWEIDQASPILSDIEFGDDGSMILGILDRVSHQAGSDEVIPLATPHSESPTLLDEMSGGDILKACYINGNYVLEGGTGCSVNDQSGVTAMLRVDDGPSGAGEFFWEDFYGVDNNSRGHPETSIGALAYKKGTNEVASLIYDADNFNQPGGIRIFDMTTGGSNNDFVVIDFNETAFDKASGLGDMELICDLAPIEIGNYVWKDENINGIQDAGEAALEGVRMELYDNAGNLLAFDSTNSNGYYFFSGNGIDNANWQTANDTLAPNTNYYIIAGGGQYANDTLTLNGEYFSLTVDSINGGANRYEIDSDGSIAFNIDSDFNGEPYIKITTGDYGSINHTYDFGFTAPVDLDFGDLPDIADGTTGINDYETYDSTGGPSHVIITGLFLGDTVDIDNDGLPNPNALGDDNDNVDDEDGITIPTNLDVQPNGVIRLPLSVTNTTTDTAYLEAWIDWNGDGDFDIVNEMVADLKDNEDGIFSPYLEISIPSNAVQGSLLGFRVRLSNTINMTPYGKVSSGEVEDYLIGIDCPQGICLPVEIQLNRG